jgi:hypothetical protein
VSRGIDGHADWFPGGNGTVCQIGGEVEVFAIVS